MAESSVRLTSRFDDAVALARELHIAQGRKGTPIPYIAHLLGVCSLVLEDGGDEDEAIAALLHDAVEDQGGVSTLELIRSRFGSRVADIVWACTDASDVPKPPWRERKEAYLLHLASATPSALRVSLADKLHNARAIVFDLSAVGDAVWSRFKAGREGALWYYDALAFAFEARGAGPMAAELRRTVTLMGTASAEVAAAPARAGVVALDVSSVAARLASGAVTLEGPDAGWAVRGSAAPDGSVRVEVFDPLFWGGVVGYDDEQVAAIEALGLSWDKTLWAATASSIAEAAALMARVAEGLFEV